MGLNYRRVFIVCLFWIAALGFGLFVWYRVVMYVFRLT